MKKHGFEAVESEIRKEKAEAMRLRRHDDVDRQYPVPAPLTPSMLTRGRVAR
jgi:hypothetical protein